MNENNSCGCTQEAGGPSESLSIGKKLFILMAALIVWWMVYLLLPGTIEWIAFTLLGLGRGTHLGEAVAFFLYDVPKVLMLLVLVVFGVGLLRSFFTPKKHE
jgi:uncharacterized protein